MKIINYDNYLNNIKKEPCFIQNKTKRVNYFFSNILNKILLISCSSKERLFPSAENKKEQNHNNILIHLREMLLPHQNILSEDDDSEFKEIYLQGQKIIYERDKMIQEKVYSSRPCCYLSLSSKVAIVSGLILAGGVSGSTIMNFRRFTDLKKYSPHQVMLSDMPYGDQHINGSLNSISANIKNPHSVDEKKITAVNKNCSPAIKTGKKDKYIIKWLSVSDLHDVVNSSLTNVINKIVKRSKNTHVIKNIYIPYQIYRILRDKKIDQRTLNFFQLIIIMAEKSYDVNKEKSSSKRNIVLLVNCIKLTNNFIFQNEKRTQHDKYSRFNKEILRKLLNIVNYLNKNDRIDTWQLLIDSNLITDRTLIQKIKNQIRIENNNDISSIIIKKHENKKIMYSTSQKMNRNDIDERHKHYYIQEKINGENTRNALDDVKTVSLAECRDERVDLNTTDIFRIISRTMKNPVSEVIKEGLIVYNYEHVDGGCKNNTKLYEMSNKIEDFINNFLSLNPLFGNVRSGISIISGLLDIMADDIDGKELSPTKIANIDSDLRNIYKSIMSSLTSEQRANLDEKPDTAQTMLEKLKFNRGTLSIQTENPRKQIIVKETYNHFINQENNNILFYNEENNWIVANDFKLNHIIKETFNKALKFFPNEKDMIFIKNSAPGYYQDAILTNNGKHLFILIDDEFRNVREIKLNNINYRYLMESNINTREDLIPVIYKGGRWHAEDKTSHAVSNDILEYIQSNNKISNKLVSKHIKDKDVSPLTLGRNIQTDRHSNNYLKIDDKYFLLRMNNAGSIYIEGETSTFPLTKNKDLYHTTQSILDEVFAITRTELSTPRLFVSNKKNFLDNSVILEINKHDFWDHGQVGQKIDISNQLKMSYSTIVEGAVRFENEDHFYYQDHLIKVTNNGDDTYTLKSAANKKNEIIVYKNTKSNTYYLLNNKKNMQNKIIKLRCISKRQTLSLCNMPYHETSNLKSLLTTNKEHSVTIVNPDETLKPSNLASGIYQNKNNELFYHFKDNEYFHCVEEPGDQVDITPLFMTIYGKNENGGINFSSIISRVSVIKDFDTKELIMSTPLEAQELVLNIDKETSRVLLEWQKTNFHGEEITSNDLDKLPTTLAEYHEFSDVEMFILYGGKKKLNTLNESNKRLESTIGFLSAGEGYDATELLSLDVVIRDLKPMHIADIYESAFNNALSTLEKAISVVASGKTSVDDYMVKTLSITDKRARSFLINALKIKLNRIHIILDRNDMSNVKILVGKGDAHVTKTIEIPLVDNTNLGFTLCDDPLDRIILNSLYIPNDFNPMSNPEQGPRQQEYFVNTAAETMLHEAVHATGSPEDYMYISSDDIGRLDSIDDAMYYIERAIRSGYMKEEFTYLSKIYFSHNPVYHRYKIENLLRPRNLYNIYTKDNYFRILLLLQNPDTLVIIMRELAKLTV